MNREGEATERGTGLALLAIVIIFGALAWGGEFAPGVSVWVFLVVDLFLLALLLVPGRSARAFSFHSRVLGASAWRER